jgi:uncharacterized membrane protein
MKNNPIILGSLTTEQIEDNSNASFLKYFKANLITTLVFLSILIILAAFVPEKYKKKLFESLHNNFFCHLVLASALVSILNIVILGIIIN